MNKRSPKEIIDTFNGFLKENRDKIDALKVIRETPYGKRNLTFSQVKELAREVKSPPYNLSLKILWKAYRELDNARVRGSDPDRFVANIIPLVSYALGETDLLEHYKDTITKRFNKWIYDQESAGRGFNKEEERWLSVIKEHIGMNLSIKQENLNDPLFKELGGLKTAKSVFRDPLENILEEINSVLSP